MMGIQLKIILTALIVILEPTFVHPHNPRTDQAVTRNVDNEREIQENFQTLFDLIAKKDSKKSETYHETLKQEIAKEQQAFDEIKEELWLARNKNAYRKMHFYKKSNSNEKVVATKRETNENKHGTVEAATNGTSYRYNFTYVTYIAKAQLSMEALFFGQDSAKVSIKSHPNQDENLYEWCSDWLNKSVEVKEPEFAHVKEFCDRILVSDNDADRFQAQQYLGVIYREMKKLDTVMTNIVMRLSAYNVTKQAYLMAQEYRIPMYLGVCYWSLHEGFKKYCLDPELNKYVKTYRRVFAHACQADWLTVKEVLECFEDVCRDVKLFENVPYPPAFLFGYEDT